MVTLFICLSSILIGYAAICNAKMDTVKDHLSISVYRARDQRWFNPAISSDNKYNKTLAKDLGLYYLPWYTHWLIKLKPGWAPISDFWHWEKAKMICSLIGTGAITFVTGYFFGEQPYGYLAAIIAIWYGGHGIVWNVVFNYYYDRKLRL